MKRNGFSLIEIMVAITISMVLVGTASVSVNKFLAKEKVNQAVSEIVSMVNLARNMAITGQSPTNFKMDYVAVTLTEDGLITAYPVNSGGLGASYFSKQITKSNLVITPISLGGLQFAAGSGKLLSKDSISFDSSPLLATSTVLIEVSSTEIEDVKTVLINHFGLELVD